MIAYLILLYIVVDLGWVSTAPGPNIDHRMKKNRPLNVYKISIESGPQSENDRSAKVSIKT